MGVPESMHDLNQFVEAVRCEVKTQRAFDKLANEMCTQTLSNGRQWHGWLRKARKHENPCSSIVERTSYTDSCCMQAEEAAVFAIGDHVRLNGLTTTHLNAKVGSVVCFDHCKQ